jgi:hypothetical protein
MEPAVPYGRTILTTECLKKEYNGEYPVPLFLRIYNDNLLSQEAMVKTTARICSIVRFSFYTSSVSHGGQLSWCIVRIPRQTTLLMHRPYPTADNSLDASSVSHGRQLSWCIVRIPRGTTLLILLTHGVVVVVFRLQT